MHFRTHASVIGKVLLVLGIAGTIAAALLWGEIEIVETANEKFEIREEHGPYTVVQVTDGDTIVIDYNGINESVRVIGIDAPEIHWEGTPECYAWEARKQAQELLADSQVKLAADASQDMRDAYGRLLAYITTESGADFGRVMIEDGFAREFTFRTPYAKQEAYRHAEKGAKESVVGMWGDCAL